MMNYFIYGLLIVLLVMVVVVTYYLQSLIENKKATDSVEAEAVQDEYIEKLDHLKTYAYVCLLLNILALLVVTYLILKGTIWEGHLMEWLNIVIRVMHITFGIAWIGASFYFVWLENALNRTKDVREELAGNLWAVHGGGFYYLEKYKVAPKVIPKDLHWFKYEAYFTWLSGFCLLFVVYYFNAQAFLVDKNILDISSYTAIGIGVGSFIVGWLLYTGLCKTPLVKNGNLFGIIGFIILCGFAYFYTHVFSARAAYVHFGALIGSIMVANVFFVIIPSQKAMVKAAKEGRPLNPQLGKNALQRSLHNNYFTLPVLFVMVSNHFPSTFGYKDPWITLMIISLGAAGVKHYLNLKDRGQYSIWVMPVSVVILLAAAFISAPQKITTECKQVSITEVMTIVNKRCVNCHSAKPTDDVFTAPPNGVMYNTPLDVIKLKDKIMQRVVVTKSMPQNNKTGMTDDERNTIRCWIEQGAANK